MTKEELEKEAEEKCAKYKLVEMETYEVEAYIEGAEPREKRIAELEKENAELKEKLYGSRLYTVNEKLNTDILLLEKLNKEQKEHIKTLEYRCESIKDTDTMELVALQKQLTKAKEIIRNCLRLWNGVMTEETVKALISEADQFLKEVSE